MATVKWNDPFWDWLEKQSEETQNAFLYPKWQEPTRKIHKQIEMDMYKNDLIEIPLKIEKLKEEIKILEEDLEIAMEHINENKPQVELFNE
tara:strand:+ start:7854 stop:8126 length:273 start_codon:yes stop_codon:yes gene_type:complete